ncbi:alpha-galactosidase [Lacticaseibacillus rhamnosus]|nr:alpha-galactosidase [Lacticaseibacillus rhamnosus]MCT3177338.1 alpha-galactosidase [Lacticaseibacillus rhamnosus]MCT3183606.1 alpha-galactosidase [Lacticaseibacillus rhamnosus]MCT4447783.1 alpha-galactosidase [Lacticaseibacillus rhamnosus]
MITRSPAQKSACKDLERNGQTQAITLKATYTPTSNRAGSRSGGFFFAYLCHGCCCLGFA